MMWSPTLTSMLSPGMSGCTADADTASLHEPNRLAEIAISTAPTREAKSRHWASEKTRNPHMNHTSNTRCSLPQDVRVIYSHPHTQHIRSRPLFDPIIIPSKSPHTFQRRGEGDYLDASNAVDGLDGDRGVGGCAGVGGGGGVVLVSGEQGLHVAERGLQGEGRGHEEGGVMEGVGQRQVQLDVVAEWMSRG